MKILWLTDLRYRRSSEITDQSLMICHELDEKGIETVLCNLVPLDIRYKHKHKQFIETELNGTGNELKLLYPVGSVSSTIQTVDPDVIMIYGTPETNVYAEISDITREYPTVYYSLVDPLEVISDHRHVKVLPTLVDFIQKVDHVIVPSEVMKHVVRSYGCMDISVIPISVDPSKYAPTNCKDPTIAIPKPFDTNRSYKFS